jgi:hypothetical protein
VDTTRVATGVVGAGIAVIAVDRGTVSAGPRFARVSEGTWIAVIAVGKIDHVLAPQLDVAGVIGARIIIVTFDRLTHANALFAGIRLGAGRAVQALSTGDGSVGAALGAIA